jgi:hypothetical protein
MDLSVISSKLEQLTTPQGSGSGQKIDRSQYFWKASIGKQQIRIVPSVVNKDNPFQEVYFHYGIGNRTMISPINFGEKDPIVEFAKELRKTSEPENWRLAKKLEPKMRVFAPVIVRGEESKGTRYWEFGKSIYQELLSLANDEDIGDFTDTSNGFDMTVEVVQGNPYPQTSVRVKPKQTSLSDDNDLVEKWTTEQPELFKYFKKYSYDEMKAALAGFLNPEESQESTPLDTANSSNSSDDIRTGNPLPNDVETKVKGENFGLNVKKKETISADEFDDLFDN